MTLYLALSLCACDVIGVKVSRVPSSAMEPAYSLGDRIWWRPLEQGEVGGIEIGDIVMYNDPAIGSDPFFKRVVGLSGDVVEIRGNRLLVNDKPQDASWGTRACANHGCDFGPVTVPANHLFMLGDNWERSGDSRHGGAIPNESVVGKVIGHH
jgi:signal peptidase I